MKNLLRLPLVVVLLAAACSGSRHATLDDIEPVAVGVGTLIVEIDGLRSSDGSVNVSVFRSADGFPQDTGEVFRSATLELGETVSPVLRLDNLDYGYYAVSMLHDVNGNGELDKTFLGVPIEGFGFSNNPSIGFGAPSFEECRFRFDGPEVMLRLLVRYF